MGKESETPDVPDYEPLTGAYQSISDDSQAQARAALERAQTRGTELQATLQPILNQIRPVMDQQYQLGAGLMNRYADTFLPIEQQLIDDYMGYALGGRRQYEQGRAMADVTQAFDAQRQNAARRLASYGIDPSQLRSSGMDLNMRAQQAAAQAAAGTGANRYVDEMERSLRNQAINLGRGNLTTGTGLLNNATGLGQTSLQLLGNTALTGEKLYQSALPWYSASNSAVGNWGNLLGQQFDQEMARAEIKNAEAGAFQGMLAGAGSGALQGFMMGGPYGAIAGAGIGALTSASGNQSDAYNRAMDRLGSVDWGGKNKRFQTAVDDATGIDYDF